MPATGARAAFVLEAFRSFTWENPNVRAIYGKVARDTKDQPIPTFFDDMTSVEAVARERAALLGQHARAFQATIGALADLGGQLDMQQALPPARIESSELAASFDCVVSAVNAYETEGERTVITLWGICGSIPSPS